MVPDVQADAFEALVGAIYLDRGFKMAAQFLIRVAEVSQLRLHDNKDMADVDDCLFVLLHAVHVYRWQMSEVFVKSTLTAIASYGDLLRYSAGCHEHGQQPLLIS